MSEIDRKTEAMKNAMEDMKRGEMVHMLGPHVDTKVALGMSVATDSIRNRDKKAAVAALKVVINTLEADDE